MANVISSFETHPDRYKHWSLTFDGDLARLEMNVDEEAGLAPGYELKLNSYDLGVDVALAVRWGKNIPTGRVVDDFVTLPDLAPTFLEAAGLTPPEVMTARSLAGVLKSDKSGLVDPSRTFAIVGRERHVAAAREGFLPYPQRAIHTKDFVYIRNFKPERFAMGDGPGFNRPDGPMPDYVTLREDTFAAFPDMDASPTKGWIATHWDDDGMERFVQYAFGVRPAEELYDLREDPDQLNNLADNATYQKVKEELSGKLMGILEETGDPRVTGDGMTFEKPPFAGELKK